MAKCIIFIEGGRNTDTGNLREGFQRLLEQDERLRGNMPRLEMSNDAAGTVKKFKYEKNNKHSAYDCILLLADLDGPEEVREDWLAKYGLQEYREQVFCMIQEMEAWFLSQPDKLHTYYGASLPHSLPKTAPTHTPNPAQKLAHCTKDYRPKGTYAKVKHGAQLLKLLNLTKLQADFPDVARLVKAL